jgi:hypothetical protein
MVCTVFPAFATSDATSDETATVTSIEITQLPTKLEYAETIDVAWDFESLKMFEDIDNEEAYNNALKEVGLKFKFDLSGIEVIAKYSDGTTAEIYENELSATVIDNLTYSEVLSYYDNDEILTLDEYKKWSNIYYRNYTVQVDYKGVTDNYSITLREITTDECKALFFPSYKVVSFKPADKMVYDINKDMYEDLYEVVDEEYRYQRIIADSTGMKVTLKHRENDEIITLQDNEISVSYYNYPHKYGELKPGVYMASAEMNVGTNEFDIEGIAFELPIAVIDTSNEKNETKPTDSVLEISTDDTATIDSTVDGDNTAIKTGKSLADIFVISFFVVMTAVVVLFYRKKIS